MNTNTTDLTQGNVTKQLIRYAVPMVLMSLLQAIYSMADMIIAGRFIGSSGISAINNAGQIMGIFTQIAIGITTGGNILVGQYFGKKEDQSRIQASVTLYSLSAILAAVCLFVLFFFSTDLLSMLGSPALVEASAYLRICAFGVFPILGYNALTAVIRGVGNSKQPLLFIAISASCNILLDFLFMGVFSMGTEGAALATVISQTLSFTLSVLYIQKNKDFFGMSLLRFGIHRDKLRLLVKLGVPCAVQMTAAGISWLTVTFLINQYGIVVSAGNGISIKIKDFCQLFTAAIANSTATMIAQTLGAGKMDRAKQTMYQAMKITVSMAVLQILLVQLAAPYLAGIFTSEPDVIAAAVLNLRIEIFGQIFYAMFLVYHALAIGAGHSMFAFISSFINCIFARTVLSLLFNHLWGIHGLYLACLLAPSISVPLGALYTRSNVWRRSFMNHM